MTLNLALGIPAYRSQIHVGHARMWITLGAALMTNERIRSRGLIDMDICGVDKARNFLVAHAMRMGADWLLMIDSDTWTDRGSVLTQMITDATTLDAAIVAAPVYRRIDGAASLNAYTWQDEKLRPVSLVDTRGLVQVDAIGAAIMAINLHKIGETMFRFTDKFSEDIDFCLEVGKLGGLVYCDPRVRTYHAKQNVMTYDPETHTD